MQDRTKPVSEQLNWKKVSTAICTKTVCTCTAFPARKCFALISSFLLIGHTKYTKHVRFYLPVPPSVTVFILTVSAFTFFTHTHF